MTKILGVLTIAALCAQLAGCFGASCNERATISHWNQPELWDQFPEAGSFNDYRITWGSMATPPTKHAAKALSGLTVDAQGNVTFGMTTKSPVSDEEAAAAVHRFYDDLGLRPYPNNLVWRRGYTPC